MKALSLTQPWPWIIFHLGKPIENRSRNLGNYRGPLALHASKGMTREAYESAVAFVRDRFGEEMARRIPKPYVNRYGGGCWSLRPHRGYMDNPAIPRGAIVGICDVVGQVTPLGESQRVEPCTGAPWVIWQAGQPWYMGAHAYVLDSVRELPEPIPCKGALGLWTPPADVVARVREQMESRHG